MVRMKGVKKDERTCTYHLHLSMSNLGVNLDAVPARRFEQSALLFLP